MKKRNFMAALLLGMALTLAGCGGKQEAGPEQTETQTQTQTENSGTESKEPEDQGEAGDMKETTLVKLGEYKGVEVQAMDTEPSKEEIQKEIDAVLEGYGQLEEVEGKTVIEEGDVVNIDYRGLLDGEAFEGGTSGEGGYDLTIGSGQFIEGFEEKLIGKELGGSYDLDLKFPEIYKNNPDLAGKPVIFEVKVNKIQKLVIPELTDEFVKKNLEYDSVEAYRKSVEEGLRAQKTEEALAKKDYDVLTAIIEASEFEVSMDQVQAEKEAVIAANQSAAASYGIDMETYLYFFMGGMTEEEFEKECEITAELRIKSNLIVEEVTKAEGISVTEEEYTQEATNLMADYGYSDLAEFEAAYTRDAIEENIVYNKTVDFLVEQAIEK